MTQLYVGNLSAEGDEESIRLLFGKYGTVCEVSMKRGYAFVDFKLPMSAEEAMRELNDSDILGDPMIVEPSHRQRLSNGIFLDNITPLRILVPSCMVGVIIGAIKMVTQCNANVFVRRRENFGAEEKAITITGPPKCCTEACYQIMKIMQNEMLMTNGMIETVKFHKPLPVVPLKILVHNELVGHVIGKGGGTLKWIMGESATKIVAEQEDMPAYNMERIIAILGTIHNCMILISAITVSESMNILSGLLNKEKPDYYRSRMMPFPECADPSLGETERDLVEDAFVSSPDYERGDERYHFGPPEVGFENGIGSHFGRSTGMMDLMDYPTNKSHYMPITSALPTTSSMSTSTFDMTPQLKMEMTKAITSQVDHSNGRISPKSMDPSVRDISTLLGFGLGGLAQCSETSSRKVFIGGLPQDVDEYDIKAFFMHFGSLTVNWPHKNHSRAHKGYAFLLFKFEYSVHKLLLSCKPEGEKHFIYIPTPTLANKMVEVRPCDSYHCVDACKPVDPWKAVFVGGVPTPLKASRTSRSDDSEIWQCGHREDQF